MRDFVFTIFRNAQDVNGQSVTLSWEEWVGKFSDHDVRGSTKDTSIRANLDREKNGPALILGRIPDGIPRKDVNVERIEALALDVEDFDDETIEAALESLKPFEFFVWTTHKHGSKIAKGLARLRVIIPLELPINPGDHLDAWNRLNRLVNFVNDPTTKNVGRLHFLPSTFDISQAWTLHNPGRLLSLEDLPEYVEPDIKTETDTDTDTDTDKDFIIDLADSLRRKIRSVRKDERLKEPLALLAKGVAFAESGARHTVLLELTMWIAKQDKTVKRAVLNTLFEPSLKTMSTTAGAPTLDEMNVAYQGALEKLEKLRQKNQADLAGGSRPYNKKDLERIAEANGWKISDLQKRWILQRDGVAWFLAETGDYVGPFGKDDVGPGIVQYLSRAPVRIIESTRNGFKYRNPVDIVREQGTVLNSIVSDLTIQRNYFDTDTLEIREAILPLRDLDPCFDPVIDQWLRLLAGSQYSKLIDFMSCCPDLTKLLCSVYFDGAASSGKTMFAHGLAKLWTDGPPADVKEVLGNFNDELSRCPVILADEEIPSTYQQSATAVLRSMLSTTSRTLKRKYRPTAELRGCVRLILAANNEFLLKSNDVASAQDLEAIAQRFLYITVSQAAADFLNDLDRDVKEEWVRIGIAKHTLWLHENHEVKEPGKRFWVEGDISQMHRLLMTGSKWNSICCEWLVKYLLSPEKFDSIGTGLIRRQDGQLFVNDQALSEGWELYLKTKLDCETAKVGAALRAISTTSKRKQLRWVNERIRYREIDVEHLISWSDQYGIGTETIIRARLTPTGKDAAVVALDKDNKSPEATAGKKKDGAE